MVNPDGQKGPKQIPMAFLWGGEQIVKMILGTLLFLMVVNVDPAQAAEMDHSGGVNCDIHQSPCTQEILGAKVILDINPKPVKAMTDLMFKVTLTGKQSSPGPYIDLGMPGMKMGPNRVLLQSVVNNIYEGTGIIVRCPSGKRIWKATVTVPDMGAAEFVFDVIY